MSENTKKNDSQKSSELVDLSSLVGITFGPSWSDSRIKTEKPQRDNEELRTSYSRPERKKNGSQQRERRPAIDRRPERAVMEIFQPILDVSFYPEDEPFLALIKALKTSCKTYELFELAHLILDKPERFVAIISLKRKESNIVPKLYLSPLDETPFEKEELAIAHTLKNHLDKFFEVEEVEIEGPKGSFPVINRCGFTGELLGPPNYHRYQDLVKEHYENNLSHIPYERFLSKIETVRDDELVKAWVEKMTKSKRYILKSEVEGEKPVFNTWEEARAYLLANKKKDLVRESSSVRLHGASLDKLPKGDIRRSLEIAFKAQRDFPLDTANNIRGRLRRMNLTIYKKGAKGVTYVCAVKRKFCQPGVTFTDNLQKLITFIQKHPNCFANKLPELYLGIRQQAATVNIEAKGEEKTVEEPVVRTSEQQSQIRQLMLDLRWLVSEGYVTEYGNGTLFAPEATAAAMAEEKEEKVQEENNASEEVIQEETVAQEDVQPVKKKAVKRTKKAVEVVETAEVKEEPTEFLTD